MRRGRHQKEMPGEGAKELSKVIPLGVLHLATEERSRELMGLIAHDEIPAAVRSLELLLHRLIAGQLIETRNNKVWNFRFEILDLSLRIISLSGR